MINPLGNKTNDVSTTELDDIQNRTSNPSPYRVVLNELEKVINQGMVEVMAHSWLEAIQITQKKIDDGEWTYDDFLEGEDLYQEPRQFPETYLSIDEEFLESLPRD